MKVAIMAGGTGGHIFPGLAVADELANKNVDVVWLGAVGGMEEKIVKKHNIPMQLLNIKALRGKGIKGLISLPFKLFSASRAAAKFFKKEQVNAVISMGGYVAGPGGLAAKFKGIPLLVHEQNSKFGMTNKYLSKWAKTVLTGFNLKGLYGSQWVGNPIRKEIEECQSTEKITKTVKILIVGGSLGAQSLNSRIPPLLNPLLQTGKVEVLHQCGKNNTNITLEHYQSNNNIQVQEFINDMCSAYSWADFIIARSGALTIAEINAVGLAAIFVPYPYAVDDHQTSNAQFVVEGKAAYIWQENHDIRQLDKYIKQLVNEKPLRDEMAANSKKLHKPQAAKRVAELCLEMTS
jgi:UDP-N-acetylglucosamine--N-acetylmuramyl-(pentapeptide) pyrophosphoryl-undecaprenol N-acetylglucosamine transferase